VTYLALYASSILRHPPGELVNSPLLGNAETDQRSLAASFAPVIAEACDGRLGEVTWFRADWQRGGAATGKATFRLDDGHEVPVVLKLPVVQRELHWMRRMQDSDDPDPVVPRLYASGTAIGGYDLAWIIIEQFEHGPLGLRWHEDHIERVADAAARFHARAAAFPVDQEPAVEPWNDLLKQALESVKVNALPDQKRWSDGIKTLRRRLDPLIDEWHARDARQWLHGDLHLANAMSRHDMNHGTVSLIDLAEVHAGHWIEDAVYLERQLWARPERTKRHKPVRTVAAARRKLGLPVEDDYARLAMVRRVLLAGTAPRFILSEGHPKHRAACLDWLETGLGALK
jgi:hypothetical protein